MRLAPDSLLTLIRLNVQKDRSRQPEIPLPKCPQSKVALAKVRSRA